MKEYNSDPEVEIHDVFKNLSMSHRTLSWASFTVGKSWQIIMPLLTCVLQKTKSHVTADKVTVLFK